MLQATAWLAYAFAAARYFKEMDGPAALLVYISSALALGAGVGALFGRTWQGMLLGVAALTFILLFVILQ